MNQHQLSDQQVVLNEDIKFCSTAFINTLCDVNEPCIEFTAGVSSFDVITDVIAGEFGDLGVDFIPTEVVILDVSGEDGCVTVVGIGGAALRSRGSSNDGLHFDVLHRLRFHVPVRT